MNTIYLPLKQQIDKNELTPSTPNKIYVSLSFSILFKKFLWRKNNPKNVNPETIDFCNIFNLKLSKQLNLENLN